MDAPIQFDAATALPILDRAFDGIALLTYSPWRMHFANRTLAAWLGVRAEELSGKSLETVFGAAQWLNQLEEQLDRARLNPTLDVEATHPIEFRSRASGATLVKAFHVAGHDSPLLGLVLRPLASTATGGNSQPHRVDPLTALPDRAFLMSRLAMLLDGERAADREFAVLFIDLDNFKQINDRNGHLIGDRVLRNVAERLQRSVRDCDHVTRYGGDEFVVLLERVSGTAEIEPVLARIRAALSEPLILSEEHVSLSLSIGVARSAPHLQSPEDVLQEADRQMYAAKRRALVPAASNAPPDWQASAGRDASTRATNV